MSVRQISSSEYLETALRPLGGSHPGILAKNQIRSSICALFPERECFCLVRPVSGERQLQALDSVPASQLRPEFRQVRPHSYHLLVGPIVVRIRYPALDNQLILGWCNPFAMSSLLSLLTLP